MAIPLKYHSRFIPVKYFLISYRALSDGETGIRHLEEYLQSGRFQLSDWKVIWIGTCTLLRSSIGLFKVDKKSCIDQKIRDEISAEWELIKQYQEQHPIYWKFLLEERNNIIHEYEWAAYQIWMNQYGAELPASSLLGVQPEDADAVLIMRNGPYKDRNSLDLLKESAKWVEERIFGAIRRAGFDPDEHRNLVDFQKPPPPEKGLLS